MDESAEPPNMSRENIQAVRMARLAVEQAKTGRWADAPNVVLLEDLLTAYDVMGGRLAWLAALYGDLQLEFAQLKDQLRRMNGEAE